MNEELQEAKVRHDILSHIETDSEEETDAFIDEHAQHDYRKKLTQSEDVRAWIDDPKQISLVQSNLSFIGKRLRRLKKPWNMLDVGCYAGYVYDYVAKNVCPDLGDFSYTGVDIRDEAINGALAGHPDVPNAEFRVADLFKLSEEMEAGTFDVSMSSRVLVHLPRFESAVLNILHCAREEALILIPVRPKGRCELRKKVDLETGEEMTYIFRWVSPPMVDAVARKAGVSSEIVRHKTAYATVRFMRTRTVWDRLLSTARGR